MWKELHSNLKIENHPNIDSLIKSFDSKISDISVEISNIKKTLYPSLIKRTFLTKRGDDLYLLRCRLLSKKAELEWLNKEKNLVLLENGKPVDVIIAEKDKSFDITSIKTKLKYLFVQKTRK